MAKRRKRLHRIKKTKSSSDISGIDNDEKFPKYLIDAYIKLKRSGFGIEEHSIYSEAAKKFLGKKYEDRMVECRLVVALARYINRNSII